MGSPDSFGPYAFTLAPAEAEAAAARLGLRLALWGGLLASHFAPLAAFALVLLFASILTVPGLISRRAGEATLLMAAGAFMIQRLISHWRIQRARKSGRAAIAKLKFDGALAAAIDDDGATLTGGDRTLRLNYADCEEAEDVGGLIYLWPRRGPPIVLPTRAFAEGEAGLLLARLKDRIRRTRRG